MSGPLSPGSRRATRVLSSVCMQDGAARFGEERVLVEEPLEIRLAQEPWSVTMRTPGQDRTLALGTLYCEGLIQGLEQVGGVRHCGRPGEEGYGNVIDVQPGPGTVFDPEQLAGGARGTTASAACGVCGRRSVESLLERFDPVPEGQALDPGLPTRLPGLFEQAQEIFGLTGGSHAALAVSARGELIAWAEDVGRHNAVDKVIGELLLRGLLPRHGADGAPALLAVSGRSGFEIVQKAVAAGFSALVGVSATTTLAVEMAERAGLTVGAFARGKRFTVYAHPERFLGS